MNTNKIHNIFYVLLAFFFLGSCKSNSQNDIDTSKINVAVSFKPFYLDFSTLDTNNFSAGILKLKDKYPQFLDFYLDTLLPFGAIKGQYSDAKIMAPIRNILIYKDYVALTDTVIKVFPDTKKQDEKILEVLKRTKYYLPQVVLPREVVYMESMLNNWTAFIHNKTLGIGLDMFLGPDFRPYETFSIPKFALINHTPECVPLWAAKALYMDAFPQEPASRKSLLEIMIENGKEMLFLEKVLDPEFKQNLIFAYTPEQMKWVDANEALIFNLLIQQQLLYSKDVQSIMRYVTPGPNSAGFPAEAPGNIGTFIGYKILKAFETQTHKPLKEILTITDANQIFQQSKYKP
ncbi:MAG TPA: hypothetical protein PKX92_10955 [Edaphocola sp.]|nr:hypothetical protein [Edaphocola sp.]